MFKTKLNTVVFTTFICVLMFLFYQSGKPTTADKAIGLEESGEEFFPRNGSLLSKEQRYLLSEEAWDTSMSCRAHSYAGESEEFDSPEMHERFAIWTKCTFDYIEANGSAQFKDWTIGLCSESDEEAWGEREIQGCTLGRVMVLL